MTAGTVVITGGILATVILLCIIAVLCYCRLQVLPGGRGGDRTGRPRECPYLGREPHVKATRVTAREVGKPCGREDAQQKAARTLPRGSVRRA